MGLPEWCRRYRWKTYIEMELPFNLGSYYLNYKGTDSSILLAMIEPEFEFLYVDVVFNDHISRRGVWSKCASKNASEQNTLIVPVPTVLAGRNVSVPYVCIGDDTFQLTTIKSNRQKTVF